MRWKFPLLTLVLLAITVLPLAAAANGAAVLVEPLDFTLEGSDPFYPGESGEGWAWDEVTKTLTLSGIDIEVGLKDEAFAIKLPDGARIILTAGTDNSVSNSYYDAIYGEGSLEITGGGNLTVVGRYEGVYTDDYHNRGDLSFVGCGNISVTSTEYYSIDAYGDINISGCGRVFSSAHFSAVWADGDVSISDCGEVDLHGMHADGISANGDVSISGCGKFAVLTGDYYAGIWADGSVSIAGCPDVNIKANIEIEDDDNGPSIEGVGNGNRERIDHGYGIAADAGSVTISGSHVEIYGASFGITTWYGWNLAGGDIIINNSYVHASCDENGYAAIFAGDDIPYGEAGEHAKIILNGCAISAPAGGRVLDVNIDLGNGELLDCQSISAQAGIEEITDWDEAAKAATIQPLAVYTLAYDANGGSGLMGEVNGLVGDGVVVLPSTFTAPAGFVFSGWNTKADGSGTAYAPGATVTLTGDMTLYAQYKAVAPDKAVAPEIKEEKKELPPASGGGTALTLLLTGCLLGGLFALARRKQHA